MPECQFQIERVSSRTEVLTLGCVACSKTMQEVLTSDDEACKQALAEQGGAIVAKASRRIEGGLPPLSQRARAAIERRSRPAVPVTTAAGVADG